MYIEALKLANFRCFGPEPSEIELERNLTAFVGSNGAGKTAVMQALQRLFGVTADQRQIRKQDFHVQLNEAEPPTQRSFEIEAIVAFPELEEGGDPSSIPAFFNQMTVNQDGKMKCRLVLKADWIDDGTLDGAVDSSFRAVRTLGAYQDSDCSDVKAVDRARIQMIYVPARRDGLSQVTAFLKGRLWRAVEWSPTLRAQLLDSGRNMNGWFGQEAGVAAITAALTARWQQLHAAGTDAAPIIRPVDLRWEEFIRKVEVLFSPTESGDVRNLDELSDGQRSLFHLSMTAATVDIESRLASASGAAGFSQDNLGLPTLTLLAVEEPENTVAPFYLSRIIGQIQDLSNGARAQAVISSHSASIFSRIDPSHVRYFRLDTTARSSCVRKIQMPGGPGSEEAAKFVRQAVQTYPELYFAKVVVLGEGDTEQIVIPKLAAALGLHVDKSFVAIVPLGGRHVNHLWRLLNGIGIPFATLLDLDFGRHGGGWGRIKIVCKNLLDIGVPEGELFPPGMAAANLASFDTMAPTQDMWPWLRHLRTYNVFFAVPIDLDFTMLRAFPFAYQIAPDGLPGPNASGNARQAVFGEQGTPESYDATHDTAFRWYRYLFLTRGKPSTHIRVLNSLPPEQLAASIPEELSALIACIRVALLPPAPPAPPPPPPPPPSP